MITALSPSFLRRALQLDAVASGATASVLAVAANLLAEPFGLSPALLRGVGIALLPFVVFVAWASLPPRTRMGVARLIVVANIAWVGSVLKVLQKVGGSAAMAQW